MKDEDIKKAKVGDKVAVIGTVKNIEFSDGIYHYLVELPNECGGTTKYLRPDEILDKLEDFTKPTKIKMTVEEKKEFDKLLKRHLGADFNDFLDAIFDYPKMYPVLHKLILENAKGIIDRKNQFEFARALENPNLIEVIKPKRYYVHLFPGECGYLIYFQNSKRYIIDAKGIGGQPVFTKDEIEEINKKHSTFEIKPEALEGVEEDD